MKEDKSAGVLGVVKPDRLLRIFISEVCNFGCTFCGWPPKQDKYPKMKTEDLGLVAQAMVATGCHNFQISGGEPLLLDRGYVLDVVSTVSSTPGVKLFWAVTNGSPLVNKQYCQELYTNGLKRINMSVAAETDEKYRLYNRTGFTLDNAFKAMQNAVETGMEVHVHVCLNSDGISTSDQLEALYNRAQSVGARNGFYFGVCKTSAIEGDFDRLYINPQTVTDGLISSGRWTLGHSETGRPFVTNGVMKVNVPRRRTFWVTDNCKRNDCGEYCQGIYSAQLSASLGGMSISACQRIFPDNRNVFRIEQPMLERRDIASLSRLFKEMWQYAYGE